MGAYSSDIDYRLRIAIPESFMGCYSLDTMPDPLPGRISSFVFNLDRAAQPGSHWLAVCFPGYKYARPLFIDSLKLDLQKSTPEIVNYFQRNGVYGINSLPYSIQNYFSESCGPFCVYILANLQKWNYNLPQLIESTFSPTDFIFNEQVVLRYWNSPCFLRNI